MRSKRCNLGCGSVFVDSPEWINFDYTPSSASVKKSNLLGRLPLEDNSLEMVYSSHFLEHIPRPRVPSFLKECYRVLECGGVIRLVLPDLENLAREYISMRDAGDHEKANFVVLELVDQCVRKTSGGELGDFYNFLRAETVSNDKMIHYVRQRVGENLLASRMRDCQSGALARKLQKIPTVLRARAERYYIRALIMLLPTAFREQNVSLANVGERHHWGWDFYQLQHALQEIGFVSVQRKTAGTSIVSGFPFYPLDLDADGFPRKGAESMFVEAIKPRPNDRCLLS